MIRTAITAVSMPGLNKSFHEPDDSVSLEFAAAAASWDRPFTISHLGTAGYQVVKIFHCQYVQI